MVSPVENMQIKATIAVKATFRNDMRISAEISNEMIRRISKKLELSAESANRKISKPKQTGEQLNDQRFEKKNVTLKDEQAARVLAGRRSSARKGNKWKKRFSRANARLLISDKSLESTEWIRQQQNNVRKPAQRYTTSLIFKRPTQDRFLVQAVSLLALRGHFC